MDQTLTTIIAFVEGRLGAKDFRGAIMGSDDYGNLLMDEGGQPSEWCAEGTYLTAMQADYGDPGMVATVRQALSEWLTRHGVRHEEDSSALRRYEILLSAQPAWLCANAAYLEELAASAPHQSDAKLKAWLKTEIRARFRYLKKPPRWLQDVEWPMGEEGPLVFVGQLDTGGLLHDEGQVYVFFDAKGGTTESIIQVR